MKIETDLSSFNNNWYSPGNPVKRFIWYFVNECIFKSGFFPFYGFKRKMLRIFGAVIGKGVLIKPNVNIKYPWNLAIGDHTWIGEKVWIDNLGQVTIGANVCISQGAFLLTGNHNYLKSSFDLMVKPIVIEDGSWVGAKSIICPGITCYTHSVLTVGSIATRDLEAYTIYQGNPAKKIKTRN